jgi:hypothetical protein
MIGEDSKRYPETFEQARAWAKMRTAETVEAADRIQSSKRLTFVIKPAR